MLFDLNIVNALVFYTVAWGLNDQGYFPKMGNKGIGNSSASTLSTWYRRITCQKDASAVAQASSTTPQSNGSVPDLIRAELMNVHLELEKEKGYVLHEDFQLLTKREQSKHLLFLFQRDLLPGVQGQILDSKAKRGQTQQLRKVTARAKGLTWALLALLNAGMLAYIFLFAVSQTGPKQRAWAQSFAVWLVVEVLLVSSCVVLVMHVILPTLIMKDVQQIQLKLVNSIKQFYQDINHFAGSSGRNSKQGSKDDLQKLLLVQREERLFNAASFLFVSHRVASLLASSSSDAMLPLPSRSTTAFSASMVARMILQFRTVWPKQSYHHITDVSKNYNKRFAALSRSASLIVFYFLTNFLTVPLSIQDMVMQVVSTATLGYTILLHLRLYAIYPVLVVVPLLLVGVIVHFVVQSFQSQNKVARRRLLHELRQADDAKKAPARQNDEESPLGEAAVAADERKDDDTDSDFDEEDAVMTGSTKVHGGRHALDRLDEDEDGGPVGLPLNESSSNFEYLHESDDDHDEDDVDEGDGVFYRNQLGTRPQPTQHVSRRQSMQQGIRLVQRLEAATDMMTSKLPNQSNHNQGRISPLPQHLHPHSPHRLSPQPVNTMYQHTQSELDAHIGLSLDNLNHHQSDSRSQSSDHYTLTQSNGPSSLVHSSSQRSIDGKSDYEEEDAYLKQPLHMPLPRPHHYPHHRSTSASLSRTPSRTNTPASPIPDLDSNNRNNNNNNYYSNQPTPRATVHTTTATTIVREEGKDEARRTASGSPSGSVVDGSEDWSSLLLSSGHSSLVSFRLYGKESGDNSDDADEVNQNDAQEAYTSSVDKEDGALGERKGEYVVSQRNNRTRK